MSATARVHADDHANNSCSMEGGSTDAEDTPRADIDKMLASCIKNCITRASLKCLQESVGHVQSRKVSPKSILVVLLVQSSLVTCTEEKVK